MSRPKTALGILKAARRFLSKKEHWRKGNLELVRGRNIQRCALGAINFAATGDAFSWKRAYLPEQVLMQAIGEITSWNDAPQRRHSQILAGFDKAVALAEKAARKSK